MNSGLCGDPPNNRISIARLCGGRTTHFPSDLLSRPPSGTRPSAGVTTSLSEDPDYLRVCSFCHSLTRRLTTLYLRSALFAVLSSSKLIRNVPTALNKELGGHSSPMQTEVLQYGHLTDLFDHVKLSTIELQRLFCLQNTFFLRFGCCLQSSEYNGISRKKRCKPIDACTRKVCLISIF